ncbi:MAG: hypothetical protein NUV35_07320, partial [Syntrophomonadaceae bacterium]|nr:hypothetical protein [Syntrophomonadaceae bacterium]
SAGMARELLEGREEARVFALSDALLQRQAPAALRALHQLLVQGEPPLRMLAVISRQFVSLGKVKACLEQGMAPAGMAERLAMKEFLVTRMARAAARFSWEELEEACLGLLSADMALKSSPLDERLVLEMLVARICLPA